MPKCAGSGRKRAVIDIKKVEELAAIQCSRAEIAAVLGWSLSTIKKYINNGVLSAAIERGKARGVASIKREQFKLLQNGNATMGVWLGKNYANQTDQYQYTGAGGGPIEYREGSAREILAIRIAGIIARTAAQGSIEGPDEPPDPGTGV